MRQGGDNSETFKQLLDAQNEWPTEFVFKFIIPKDQLSALEKVLEGFQVKTRASRNGNYLAVTSTPIMESSEAVIRIYRAAAEIDGIVSL